MQRTACPLTVAGQFSGRSPEGRWGKSDGLGSAGGEGVGACVYWSVRLSVEWLAGHMFPKVSLPRQ